MIDTVTIINMNTGVNINLTKDGYEYFVLDEIDWDEAAITMNTYELPKQIGSTAISVSIGTRKPKITGYVIGLRVNDRLTAGTWKERWDQQEEMIEQNKNILNRVMNPFHILRIVAGEYYLEGRCSTLPKYSKSESENNQVLCKFSVEFECFDPMFKKTEAKSTLFAEKKNKFVFPWVIKKTGNIFGVIEKNKLITVTNDGDVETGAVIEMSISGGEVKNPSFFDATTREQIKIEGTYQDGDKIVIDTNIGNESAVLIKEGEDQEQVLLGYMTDDSVFVQIKQGEEVYGYTADGGTDVFMSVIVTIEEKFFCIDKM